jgi:hypothetical protein
MSYPIKYIKYDDEKLLPFQYYNAIGFITIPIRNKRPFIKNWSTLTKTIEPSYFDDDIALHTGLVNNIIVIDIDQKDNGMVIFNQLKKNYSPINTPTYSTPSGGMHMVFQYDDNISTKIKIKLDGVRIGWDILSNKHLAICPPSNGYKWKSGLSFEDVTIKKIPKWIKSMID